MLTTTLNRIRAHRPCREGWETLLTGLGKTAADDEPLPYARILEINGFDDALWCCRAEPQFDREWRLYAVWCARQVQHLMTDQRSIDALDVADRYANGNANIDELRAAERAARSAEAAARAAAWSAWAAGAEAAAWSAWSAEMARAEMASAVWAAAAAKSRTEMRARQAAAFLRVVSQEGEA